MLQIQYRRVKAELAEQRAELRTKINHLEDRNERLTKKVSDSKRNVRVYQEEVERTRRDIAPLFQSMVNLWREKDKKMREALKVSEICLKTFYACMKQIPHGK